MISASVAWIFRFMALYKLHFIIIIIIRPLCDGLRPLTTTDKADGSKTPSLRWEPIMFVFYFLEKLFELATSKENLQQLRPPKTLILSPETCLKSPSNRVNLTILCHVMLLFFPMIAQPISNTITVFSERPF